MEIKIIEKNFSICKVEDLSQISLTDEISQRRLNH